MALEALLREVAALRVADGCRGLAALAPLLARVRADELDLRGLDGLGPLQGWRSVDLLEGPAEVTLFLLPPGEELPLHDHPGMSVLTRVVRGEMELAAWDRCGADGARLAWEGRLGPDDPPHLTEPGRGNLHRLRALAPTAFLDVFLPGYDPPRRPCSYFRLGAPRPDGTRALHPSG